jgi:predicted small lipoprotein YifL
MMRMTMMLLVVTALAFLVTACGKAGSLQQPEDVKPTYPRTYPSK